MVVTHTFHFMFCQSSFLSTVISFVYKDKWWFDESMSVIFYMENIGKTILSFRLHIELNLQTFLSNWRGSPKRPCKMKSIIQKSIIPARTQSQDKEFQTSWPCEVRRSSQVTTFVVCAVFSLSFQAVVLLTKTAINHRVFFNQVWDERMDLRNSNDFELRNFYFINVSKLFSKIFIRSGKMHHVELNSGTSKLSK